MSYILLHQDLKKSISKKIVFAVIVFSLFPFFAYSSHIIGGELNYKCLGNNLYEVKLRVFRDCNNANNASYDATAAIGIFDVNNALVTTLYINFPGSTIITPTIAQKNPCVKIPLNTCVEVAEYVTTVTLPPRVGGYQLVYQRCCRNATINNIANPGSQGATYYAKIPDQSVSCNSNPVFKQMPPLFVCADNPLIFDNSATDAEGDSISYSICTPYNGATSGTSMPQPPSPPPYSFVPYKAPYTAGNPMGGVPLSIDPKTGQLTGTPSTLGQFVVGVCANEYRNGVLLSTTKRDFQFNVVSCEPDVAAAAAASISDCVNHTVTFTNNSTGAGTYLWNFGDLTTTADTSKLTNPTYTYPTAGTFTVTLIAFSPAGKACNDTLKNYIVVVDTCKPCGMTLGITKVDATCGTGGCTTTVPVLDTQNGKTITAGATNTTISWTHTVTAGGLDRLLIVQLSSITYNATSVTYAGIPLTLLGKSSNGIFRAEMWYLLAPPTGANTVDVIYPAGSGTFYAEKRGESFSFTSVNQTTPFNTPVTPSGNTGCPASFTIPSGTDELVLDMIVKDYFYAPAVDNVLSPMQVQKYSRQISFNPSCAGSLQPGAAPTVTSNWKWTFCGTYPWCAVGVSMKPACSGGPAPGNATVTSSGGTAPYSYSWNTSPVQTGSTATNLSAGTYSVTVVDAVGCIQTASVIIDAGSTITLTPSQTSPTSCSGSDGTAAVTAAGGTPPYTYLWSNGQTTPTATGLSAGLYSVKVVDSTGCSKSASFVISQPTIITVSAGKTDVVCSPANGTATSTPGGGVGPYTYLWSNGQTTNPATSLSAGYYVVTVTDAGGCSGSSSVTVANSVLKLSTSKTDAKCYGGSSGTASVTATNGTPGYSYSWSTTPVQTTATAINLSTGTYTVVVTDNGGCSSSASLTISEPALLDPEPSNTSTVACAGTTNGSATVVVNGGTSPYTYLWCNGQTTSAATAIPQGTCAITVTDANSCSVTDSVNIILPVALSLTKLTSDAICNATNSGSATVTPAGGQPGYTYSWSTSPVQTTQTATGLSSGTYTVVVTDAAGCKATINNAVINQPAPITFTQSSTPAGCGLSDGTATVTASGGTPAYTYSWSTSPVQTTQTATGLSTGTYTVVVTDNAGCTGLTTIVVSQSGSGITIAQSITAAGCNLSNGTATVTASGGTPLYTYSWNTAPAQTTQTATGLSAGTYIVIVTDNKGCTSSASVSVTNSNAPTAVTSAVDVTCNGGNNGSATVTASGGSGTYTYSWNTIPVQTTVTASGLTAGTYIITVTDNAGCIFNTSVTVNQPTAISILKSSTTAGCNLSNGTASVTASGGNGTYTYSWNSSPVQTTQTATGLSAATYTVIVTDNKGCTSSTSVSVINPSAPTATTSSVPPNCNGGNNGTATVTASGGSGTYTYSWNTSPVQTTVTATGLTAGTYNVTVTDNAGCVFITSVVVSQPTAITLVSSKTTISCNGSADGTASVTATGGNSGYLYSWTPVAQTTQTATGLSAGTYTITVTDSKGCTASLNNIIITQPTAISIAKDSTASGCSGSGGNGTATITASGGNGTYTYSWNTSPVQTTSSATGLSVGTYVVTVTDGNNCTATASVTVNGSGGTFVVADFTMAYTLDCDNGEIVSFTNLSTNATSYLWDFGDGTTSTLMDPVHVYPYGTTATVTLTAMLGGCSDTMSLIISVNAFNDYISPSVPNVFTPNDDGTNDCFEVWVGNGLEKCAEIIIFDRWGLRLYDSETGGACWDGRTTSGSLASQGTYFYLIKIGDYEKHGTLSLFR